MFQLTKEGKEYLKEGLPEKRLLGFVSEANRSLEDIAKLPGSNIAIGWARKNGWIEVRNGSVKLTDAGQKAMGEAYHLEEGLEKINQGHVSTDDAFKILFNRGLVKEVKENIAEKIIDKVTGKPDMPDEITTLTTQMIKTQSWKGVPFKQYDVQSKVPRVYPGKKQPYMEFIENIKTKLVGMGFQEMKGPYVEEAFWNADALFMPQDHPGRSVHDVFMLKQPEIGSVNDKNLIKKVRDTHQNGWITGSKGWGGDWSEVDASRLVMRSQGTAVSARMLYEIGDKPGKYFLIDKVFRYDELDAKHLLEFDQMEGIVIGEKLTFRHLLGFLKEFADMIGATKVRFKPGYFPFTEPSTEMYMYFPKFKWVEVGGAGLFRPEVLKPLGIENNQVLAWGLGLGRLAMLKMGIDDIRYLYSDNLKWLREKEMML